MGNASDFIVENGVLKEYVGPGGDVIIPAGVTAIGSHAFGVCERLASVVVPEGVTSLGSFSFGYCTNLKTVTLPSSLKGVVGFVNCSSLAKIHVPEGVTYIGRGAFENCTALREVVIPTSVTHVSSDAFRGCDRIERLDCPTKWYGKVFGDGAIVHYLLGNHSLQDSLLTWVKKKLRKDPMKYFEPVAGKGSDSGTAKILEACAPVSLSMLDDFLEIAAKRDAALVTAMLIDYKNANFSNDEVRAMENDKLDKALGLKPLTEEEWKRAYLFSKKDNAITIKKYKGMERCVEIPTDIGGSPVVSVAREAFKGQKTVECILIPEGVKEIGASAFEGCSGLCSVKIPDSVKIIGSSAFKGCVALQSICLPGKLNIVAACLFDGCVALRTVTLPDDIVSISYYAFRNCKTLSALDWPSKLEIVWADAFANCKGLAEITLPDGLKKIEERAFRDCVKLTKIRIPTSTKFILPDAFKGCKKLTIQAPAGSRAENYAKKNNIPFVAE